MTFKKYLYINVCEKESLRIPFHAISSTSMDMVTEKILIVPEIETK